MIVEHAEELKELEQHVERVLDLFPWRDDSPISEGGAQTAIATRMRTPQQIAAENRLRALRAGLRSTLGAINGYRESAS